MRVHIEITRFPAIIKKIKKRGEKKNVKKREIVYNSKRKKKRFEIKYTEIEKRD